MYMAAKEKKMHKTYRQLAISSITLLMLAGCSGGDNTTKAQKPESTAKQTIVVTENAVEARKNEKSKENSGQFYYSYNKEKNSSKYNSEDSKTRTELDAYRDIRSPYERVQITLMVKQLSPDYRLLCSACHDDYANGVIGPALLDKNATYIYEQIMAFKTGTKKNVLMSQLVKRIEESRLKAIAKEIERFNKQILEMRSK